MESQFYNCSSSSLSRSTINYICTVTSSICLTILLLLLVLLIFYRAYKTILQRLYLYFLIATVLNTLVYALNVELQLDIDKRFCSWLGFLEIWSENLTQLLTFGLTVYLVAMTYRKLRGKDFKKNFRASWEVIYICGTILFPMVYLWVPFHHNTYGISETICWMKTYDIDCNPINMTNIDYTIVNITNWLLKIIVLISFLALIAVFYSVLKRYRDPRHKNSGAIGRSLILIVLLCISTVFEFSEMVVNLLYLSQKIDATALLSALLFDTVLIIPNLLVPIGFAVYLYSPKKLSIKSIKQEALNWRGCCYRRKKQYINIDDKGLKTIHNSSAGYVPSHTTCTTAIPYTNEFTNIAESIMLNPGETKYGAISPKK